MRYGRYGLSFLCLRFGLGGMFLWLAADMVRHPDTWKDIAAAWNLNVIIASILCAAVAIMFLASKFIKIAGLAGIVGIGGVIMSRHLYPADILLTGLLAALLSVLVWPKHYHKSIWHKIFKKKNHYREFDEE